MRSWQFRSKNEAENNGFSWGKELPRVQNSKGRCSTASYSMFSLATQSRGAKPTQAEPLCDKRGNGNSSVTVTMIVAGIDVGSRTCKAVIMKNRDIISYSLCDTGPEIGKIGLKAIESALRGTTLSVKDIQYLVATGYGRMVTSFANRHISEISCHAKGVHWYFPSARTILDMGGQDCKAILCDDRGRVRQFIMNDKCAGGTGRFLEIMAEVIQVPIDEIGKLSLESTKRITFNSICAIFAKSQALVKIKQGERKSDVLAGLNDMVADQYHNLLKRIPIQKDLILCGGVAKNIGVVTKLKQRVGIEPLVPQEPQIIGAVGAALFASEILSPEKTSSVTGINIEPR